MLEVFVGTNTTRHKVSVDPSRTLRDVLESEGVNYQTTTVHMDGSALKPGDMDKSFADLGVTEKCYLIAVVKTDNA